MGEPIGGLVPYRFDWSMEITEAVRHHVHRAVSRLEPDRYSQVPAYVAALIVRLNGVVYEGREGRVEIAVFTDLST